MYRIFFSHVLQSKPKIQQSFQLSFNFSQRNIKEKNLIWTFQEFVQIYIKKQTKLTQHKAEHNQMQRQNQNMDNNYQAESDIVIRQNEAQDIVNTSYYKSFKEQLLQKYQSLSQQQLLKKLIQKQIANKQLSNRLSDLEPFKQRNLKPPNKQKSAKLFQQFQTQKFALKICYLGHLYDGMALQMETQNTVEQYLFRCMHTLNLIETARPGSDYTRAGRTDKGVSAMGNVVALKLRTKIKKETQQQSMAAQFCQNNRRINQQQEKKVNQFNYCDMLNSILPEDIRILACEPVEQEFNARYWCKRRSYKYFFVKNNLNIQAMAQAIRFFEGKHNFVNFCKINLCNTVNFQREIIKANIVKVQNQFMHKKEGWQSIDGRNEVYYFHFVGNSFLWHQIRFMSSVLFMIGQGSQPIYIIEDLLSIQKYPRKPNYSMAPQYPLILEDCLYENHIFKPNPETIFRFYNTFHQMISRTTIEQTLIINCMHMAKRDLMSNIQLSNEGFIQNVLETYKKTHKVHKKSMELHKASGRGMEESINSLKGKKKQLYEKKAQKQADFQAKQTQKQKQKNVNILI